MCKMYSLRARHCSPRVTETMKTTTVLILLALFRCDVTTTGGDPTGRTRLARFQDDAVNISVQSTSRPLFSINGTDLSELEEDIRDTIEYYKNGGVYQWSFPALMKLDNLIIELSQVNGTETVSMILRIQGVLNSVKNLTSMSHNSTYQRLLFDQPDSLMGHEETKYEVVIEGVGDWCTKNTTVIFKRPWSIDKLVVTVTPWNPVGKGESNMIKIGLERCKDLGDINPTAEPRDPNTVVIELFTVEKTGYYCVPDCITVVFSDDKNTTLPVEIKDGTAVVWIRNITGRKYWNTTIVIKSLLYFNNITFSTFKTQHASISDGLLQCVFIDGTQDRTCVVKVFRDQSYLHSWDGSDSYHLVNLTAPGHYTLEVYDDKLQQEAAFVLNHNVEAGGEGLNGLVVVVVAVVAVVLGVGVAVLVTIAVIIFRLCKKYEIHTKLCHLLTKKEETDKEGHTLSADDNTISHPEETETDKTAMVPGKHNGGTRQRRQSSLLRSEQNQQLQRKPAEQEEITIEDVKANAGDGSAQQIVTDDERQDCVVPGLENTTSLPCQSPEQASDS